MPDVIYNVLLFFAAIVVLAFLRAEVIRWRERGREMRDRERRWAQTRARFAVEAQKRKAHARHPVVTGWPKSGGDAA